VISKDRVAKIDDKGDRQFAAMMTMLMDTAQPPVKSARFDTPTSSMVVNTYPDGHVTYDCVMEPGINIK